MNHHTISALAIVALAALPGACTERAPAPSTDMGAERACDPVAARAVAERFGERLKDVPLLAPDTVAAREIRARYAPLVTPELLERWAASPGHAPGREASSPWPERIEVRSVRDAGEGRCRVEGEVIYLTSEEVAHGGAAARAPVTIEVVNEGGWRVSAYRAGAEVMEGASSVDTAPAGVEIPPDTASAAAAVDVLRRYYGAINARDYRSAYALWGDSGRASGKTYEEFAAGYAATARVELELGAPGRVEGAAGSRYVEVPVTLRAVHTDGSVERFAGTYTLRRVVVEGATPAQRRWHIETARVRQVGGRQ